MDSRIHPALLRQARQPTSAIDRALAKIEAGTRYAARSPRQSAAAFHKLAVETLRPAIEQRRWLRGLSARNPGVGQFYGDLVTPERMALVKQYRDLARKFRRIARNSEALVSRHLLAAEEAAAGQARRVAA